MTLREIDERICRDVFKQVPCDGWMPTGSPFFGVQKVCKDHADGECYPVGKALEYSSNPGASKQLREKLAERWDWILGKGKTRPDEPQFGFSLYRKEAGDAFPCFESETDISEELAVALCALRTVSGPKATPIEVEG